jgi:hypothetical protein
MDEASMREDVTRFSTARTTPEDVWMPIAVEPSYCIKSGQGFSFRLVFFFFFT